MIKLNAQKDSTIQFDIDVKNMGDGNLQGYFRLMHESIEYGFSVQINGRRAKIVIPALDGIISGLTNESEIKSKLEFVGGSDYVKAFEDDVELHVPPKVEKVQIVVKEKEPLAVSIKSAELEETPGTKDKTKVRGKEKKVEEAVKVSATPITIEVSDEVWAKTRPRTLTEADKKKTEDRYKESNKLAAEKLKGAGGFADFFTEE